MKCLKDYYLNEQNVSKKAFKKFFFFNDFLIKVIQKTIAYVCVCVCIYIYIYIYIYINKTMKLQMNNKFI